MVIFMIVGAFFVGKFQTEVQYLKKGVPNTVAQVQGDTTQQAAPVTIDINKVKDLFKDSKHIILGDKNSKLLFVEFSDPSCPYCHVAAGVDGPLNKQMGTQFTLKADGGTYQAAVPEIRKLVEAGKAALAWVYVPGHGNGEVGTLALYCANEKGKFWQAHDLLMNEAGYNLLNTTVKNDRAQSQTVADFLKSAVDPGFMKSCIDSGKYNDRITSDPQLGGTFGASATPTFLVNDKIIEGASPWDTAFKSLVDPLI